MGTPDPSLGISTSFDADLFRRAITFAEQMGTPPDSDRRPKFVKPAVAGRTYWKDGVQLDTPPPMGRTGEPLDVDIEVRTPQPVIVEDANCAIEIERVDADELPVGKFLPSKAVVTLLDIDYAKIAGCKEMTYNGDRYGSPTEPEALGMFEVGIHTIIFYAIDDT